MLLLSHTHIHFHVQNYIKKSVRHVLMCRAASRTSRPHTNSTLACSGRGGVDVIGGCIRHLQLVLTRQLNTARSVEILGHDSEAEEGRGFNDDLVPRPWWSHTAPSSTLSGLSLTRVKTKRGSRAPHIDEERASSNFGDIGVHG